MPTFVFNDDTTINSYGFRILTAGINLDRFTSNPVMLDSHDNECESVLGRWENVKKEGKRLVGDSVFDVEDPKAKLIGDKVDRGFIKGCSMGVTFDRGVFEQTPDGEWVLTACELFECSICAVPSAATSLRLYEKTEKGEYVLMDEKAVQLTLATLAETKTNPQPNMEKIALSAAVLVALGLTTQPENAAALEQTISNLAADRDKYKKKATDLEEKINADLDSRATALGNAALSEGKITKDELSGIIEDAKANYDLTARSLARIPAKVQLGAGVKNPTPGESEIKTMDDFEKLSDAAKMSFKTENPDAYKALFKK